MKNNGADISEYLSTSQAILCIFTLFGANSLSKNILKNDRTFNFVNFSGISALAFSYLDYADSTHVTQKN